jgi:hypothetical protein
LGKTSREASWPAFCEALGKQVLIEWPHDAFRYTPPDETMRAATSPSSGKKP